MKGPGDKDKINKESMQYKPSPRKKLSAESYALGTEKGVYLGGKLSGKVGDKTNVSLSGGKFYSADSKGDKPSFNVSVSRNIGKKKVVKKPKDFDKGIDRVSPKKESSTEYVVVNGRLVPKEKG